MSVFDKLVQALRKVPPNVRNTPMNRNQYIEEIGMDTPVFLPHIEGDYKVIAYELWKIIEDIEKAESVTTDYLAFRSIVTELSEKRYIYMNEEQVKQLEQYQLEKQNKKLEVDGI